MMTGSWTKMENTKAQQRRERAMFAGTTLTTLTATALKWFTRKDHKRHLNGD